MGGIYRLWTFTSCPLSLSGGVPVTFFCRRLCGFSVSYAQHCSRRGARSRSPASCRYAQRSNSRPPTTPASEEPQELTAWTQDTRRGSGLISPPPATGPTGIVTPRPAGISAMSGARDCRWAVLVCVAALSCGECLSLPPPNPVCIQHPNCVA